jgi:hypothetical protein
MNATPATVVAAAGLFAGTRIDDIVTVAVLNMSCHPGLRLASIVDGRPEGPIYAGQPGYRPGLDRDGDGVACEWKPVRLYEGHFNSSGGQAIHAFGTHFGTGHRCWPRRNRHDIPHVQDSGR